MPFYFELLASYLSSQSSLLSFIVGYLHHRSCYSHRTQSFLSHWDCDNLYILVSSIVSSGMSLKSMAIWTSLVLFPPKAVCRWVHRIATMQTANTRVVYYIPLVSAIHYILECDPTTITEYPTQPPDLLLQKEVESRRSGKPSDKDSVQCLTFSFIFWLPNRSWGSSLLEELDRDVQSVVFNGDLIFCLHSVPAPVCHQQFQSWWPTC